MCVGSALNKTCVSILVAVLLAVNSSSARGDTAVLEDVTGDGEINVLAFGDSITYGVGDGIEPGFPVEIITDAGSARGYPQRVSAATGLGISNAGVPGERFREEGLMRLPKVVVGTDVDTVVFMEGANDAIHQIDGEAYRRALQKVINVVRAEGKQLVVATLPPPTASRAPLALFTALYSSIVRELGFINSIPVADIEQRFNTDCPDLSTCSLYNLPEGLHPNTSGYDVIAEVVQTALSGGGN